VTPRYVFTLRSCHCLWFAYPDDPVAREFDGVYQEMQKVAAAHGRRVTMVAPIGPSPFKLRWCPVHGPQLGPAQPDMIALLGEGTMIGWPWAGVASPCRN